VEPKNVNYDDSVAYEASAIIKDSSGTLYRLMGYNSGGAQFLQLHDSATVPADNAIPKVLIAIAATANFDIDLGEIGRFFNNGIVVCNSSTEATKTIGAADCWFSAWYK